MPRELPRDISAKSPPAPAAPGKYCRLPGTFCRVEAAGLAGFDPCPPLRDGRVSCCFEEYFWQNWENFIEHFSEITAFR
jgi:hypothetical protein